MTEIHPTEGPPTHVDETDVDQLRALALLTGRSPADLFHSAIEKLRYELVPSTRPVVQRTRGKAKTP